MDNLNYQNFLYYFFRDKHLGAMPSGQKAYLTGLGDKRSDAQKAFGEPKMFGKQAPSISNMAGGEPLKLYTAVSSALHEIAGKKDQLVRDGKEDAFNKLMGFVGDTYREAPPGTPTHSFLKNPELQEDSKKTLDDIVKIFNDETDRHITSYIEANIFRGLAYSASDFIKDRRNHNFSNPKFINSLRYIHQDIGQIAENVGSGNAGHVPNPTMASLSSKLKFQDLEKTINDIENPTPDSRLLDKFYRQDFDKFMGLLYGNEAVRKIFGETSSGGKITSLITNAEASADYKDIPFKMDDKKVGILSWGKELIDNLADGTVAKLKSRHMRHVYITPAKDIMNVIVGTKVKSGDKEQNWEPGHGLGAIVEKEEAIGKKIEQKNPGASKGWKFLIGTLKELQGPMKEAFKGCLKNGKQMRAIVEQVIAKAMESSPPKMNEAKTAMECLSVMRYGLLDNEKWDAFKKPIDFFEKVDSIPKEGFMRWLATGTNKVINGITYGVFWAGNALMYGKNQYGRRFKGIGSEGLSNQLQAKIDEFGNPIDDTTEYEKALLDSKAEAENRTTKDQIKDAQDYLLGMAKNDMDSALKAQEDARLEYLNAENELKDAEIKLTDAKTATQDRQNEFKNFSPDNSQWNLENYKAFKQEMRNFEKSEQKLKKNLDGVIDEVKQAQKYANLHPKDKNASKVLKKFKQEAITADILYQEAVDKIEKYKEFFKIQNSVRGYTDATLDLGYGNVIDAKKDFEKKSKEVNDKRKYFDQTEAQYNSLKEKYTESENNYKQVEIDVTDPAKLRAKLKGLQEEGAIDLDNKITAVDKQLAFKNAEARLAHRQEQIKQNKKDGNESLKNAEELMGFWDFMTTNAASAMVSRPYGALQSHKSYANRVKNVEGALAEYQTAWSGMASP